MSWFRKYRSVQKSHYFSAGLAPWTGLLSWSNEHRCQWKAGVTTLYFGNSHWIGLAVIWSLTLRLSLRCSCFLSVRSTVTSLNLELQSSMRRIKIFYNWWTRNNLSILNVSIYLYCPAITCIILELWTPCGNILPCLLLQSRGHSITWFIFSLFYSSLKHKTVKILLKI